MSSLEGLEAFVRVLGLPYRRHGDSIVVEFEDPRLGSVGIVVFYEGDTGVVRIVVPTDVEPTPGGLRWLLEENFRTTTYKYGLDYEGFVAVIVDLPAEAVENARSLRRGLAEAVEGVRRLMERVEEAEEAGEGGG